MNTLNWMTILVGGGVITAIATGLSTYLNNLLNSRRTANQNQDLERLKQEYTQEIERLRAYTNERRDLLTTTMATVSGSYAASHEKIADGMGSLWKNALQIREIAYRSLLVYMILSPEEYHHALSGGKSAELIPRDVTPDSLLENLNNLRQSVEADRPFIGERLWELFSLYGSIATRSAWKVLTGRDNGAIYPWDKNVDGTEDTALKSLVSDALSDEEMQAILTDKETTAGLDPTVFGIPQRIMDILTLKMLAEIDKLTFGRSVIDRSIVERQRVEAKIRRAEI